jgi:hypothetical protein
MATPQKVSVVLNTPNDWDEWIQVVKRQAIAGDIWEHVDPKKDQIPTLDKPEKPTPQQVNRDKTAYADLSVDEREEFRIMRQDYKQQFDLYERHTNVWHGSTAWTNYQRAICPDILHL